MNGYYFQQRRNTGGWFKEIFFGSNVLSRLILINTIVFIIAKIILLVTWLISGHTPELSLLGQIMALPADFSQLIRKPWTIFTYMFLQEGFLHWLFNMIMLYYGGLLFLEYLSQRKLLFTYIIGGLAGAVFFVLAFNIFPAFSSVKEISIALGASASILAIIIAISTYVPDYAVYLFLIGKVKLKYLAIAFVLLDLFSIQSGNPGGHIAHLGGALWGFLYGYYLRKGTDIYRVFGKWRIPSLSLNRNKFTKFTTERPASGRPFTDEEYNKRKAAKQHEVDAILDKISKSGYSSLTKEEKEFLFKSSKK